MAYFLYKDSLYIENIESVYIKNQKTIKTADILSGTENSGSDNSAEAQIYRLFHEFREKENIYTDEILKTIDEIHWGEYSRKYGGGAYAALDLLEWLSHNPRIRIEQDEETIVKIFHATNGLDGALAEQYSVIVGNFFRNDKEKFVKVLSNQDDVDIEKICSFAAYNCAYYDMSEQDIKAYFESKKLSDKEKEVVDELIKAFANPY
jgi:hypothetical protein